MAWPNSAGPVTAETANEARRLDQLRSVISSDANENHSPKQPGGLHAIQPTSRDQTIRAGERALDDLPTSAKTEIWDRWMRVAAALDAIQTEAMFIAQINAPDGSNARYRRAYADLVKRHRFDRINKADRSRLVECLRNRIEIEHWLEGLPARQRLTMTNPFVILRNWQRTNRPSNDKPRPRSRIQQLEKANAELEREIARLRDESGGTLSNKDSARDVARLLRGLFSQSKLGEIRRLLKGD